MDSQDVDVLVSKIEIVLKKFYIISTTFQDIHHGNVNNKRRRVIYLKNGCFLAFFLICTIWTTAPSDSALHFYFLNPLHGLGKVGRFVGAFFAIGIFMILLHSLSLLQQEKKAALAPVTDLRQMLVRLRNPSPEEIKRLIFFMKLLSLLPWFNLFLTVPLAAITAIGSIITAYEFNSGFFLLLRILSCLVESLVVFVPAAHVFAAVHLLAAQSSRYLILRLDANFQKLSQILSQWCKKDRWRLTRKVHTLLIDLHNILNEIRDHNLCIQHFFRDALLCIECVVSCLLVFVLESNTWYERFFLLLMLVSVLVFLSFSSFNAGCLFLRIRSTARLLHSLQGKIYTLESLSRHRSASVVVRNKEDCHLTDVIKAKHQILRLIHRMSSPFLKVGFTDGDVDSFTPMSVASSVSTIISMSLMFLNAKYSSV